MTGVLVLSIWLYILLFRGRFWLVRDESRGGPELECAPRVLAIVPARNEAATVAPAIASLAAQSYPGDFRIMLVDDRSTDDTAALARSAAPSERLMVISAAPLPRGWTGKLWALSEGVRRSASTLIQLDAAPADPPDYYLFTDADIVHPPGALRSLIARAEADRYDVVSYMVTLACRSTAERALIPAFVFFFFLLYPPAWIRDPHYATAGAAGGCILIRRDALESIGGLARIRGEWIDDCALAAAVKRNGGRVWLGLSDEARSIRDYATFGEIGRMISRTAFTELNHSIVLLGGALAGLTLTYLVPPALALAGSLTGVAAWLLMCVAYFPILRFYRRSPLWAPLLPLIAAFYMGATIHSAIGYWRGTEGSWKGRVHDRTPDSAAGS
jgi:hopene-associated glycosyltransferase HpnB